MTGHFSIIYFYHRIKTGFTVVIFFIKHLSVLKTVGIIIIILQVDDTILSIVQIFKKLINII